MFVWKGGRECQGQGELGWQSLKTAALYYFMKKDIKNLAFCVIIGSVFGIAPALPTLGQLLCVGSGFILLDIYGQFYKNNF